MMRYIDEFNSLHYAPAVEFKVRLEKDSGEQEEFMAYIFSKVNDEEKIWGTSKICNVYGFDQYEKNPLVFGKMLTLFGDPLYTTNNLENQYSYVISAADGAGHVIYLSVYSGPSGPSIGGDKGSEKAAEELVHYILQAKTSDYEYEGYYMDAPCKVKIGVKNGVPYQEEEMLDLTDEEFERIF